MFQVFVFPSSTRIPRPSNNILFIFVDESPEHLMMQYRTRRRGFHYYVQGQVQNIVSAKNLIMMDGLGSHKALVPKIFHIL